MKAELIDRMGTDLTVVNAARVSFDKTSEWENVHVWEEGMEPVLHSGDRRLIEYLAEHNHWTPFSHVQITMRETVPIFVARQRFKHVVGFTYNEISRRYVDDPPEFYVPDGWRKSAENKKQGSSDEFVPEGRNETDSDPFWTLDYQRFLIRAETLYSNMIEAGIAPEQARMVLPQSMYTSYYVTGSLSAWARAWQLRSDPHAQMEIQGLAHQWNIIIGGIDELKHSWAALVNKH